MAILGWFVLLVFTVWVSCAAFAVLIYDGYSGSRKLSMESVIFTLIAAALWWATFSNSPFTVSLTQ